MRAFKYNTSEDLQELQELVQDGELREFLKNELLICFAQQILIDALTPLEPFLNTLCEEATQDIFKNLETPSEEWDLSQLEEITGECEILTHFSEQIQRVIQVELEGRKGWEEFEALNKEDLLNYSCLEATNKAFAEWTIKRMSCHDESELEKLDQEESLRDQLNKVLGLHKRALPLMLEAMHVNDICHEIFKVGITFSTFNFSNLNEELEQLVVLRLVSKSWSTLPLPKDHFFASIQSKIAPFAQYLLKLKGHCKDGELSYIDDHYYNDGSKKSKVLRIEHILLVQCIDPKSKELDMNNFWITPFHEKKSYERESEIKYIDGMPNLSLEERLIELRENERKILLKNRFLNLGSVWDEGFFKEEYNFLLPVKLLMQMGEPALQKL
ncbi:MAG: hypothetical protein H0T62_11045 [Parachlamydiaceae bacterium]|nr:hypothetical protein [Parachlamydiaceae bacterium]